MRSFPITDRSIDISGRAVQMSVEEPTELVIDDFEEDRMSEYSGDLDDFDRIEASTAGITAEKGDWILEPKGSRDEIVSTSGLPNYFAKGEESNVYVRFDSTDTQRVYFLYGVQDIDNWYGAEIEMSATVDDALRFKISEDGSISNGNISRSTTFPENEWLRLNILWDDGTLGGEDNDMTLSLYDNTDTFLDSVTWDNAVFATETGVGFRCQTLEGSQYYDNWHKP